MVKYTTHIRAEYTTNQIEYMYQRWTSECMMCPAGGAEGGNNAKQLHDDILANYSTSVRPRKNYTHTVMVEVDFVLHQVTFLVSGLPAHAR